MNNELALERLQSSPSQTLTNVRRILFGNKLAGTLTGVWLCGLLVAFVLPAPVAVTEQSLAAYNDKIHDVLAIQKHVSEVEDDYVDADYHYRSEAVCTSDVVNRAPRSMVSMP
jgi:hypothetical protein